MPFINYICTAGVKGVQLLEALESSCSQTPEELGGFPRVPGITLSVNTQVPFEKGALYPSSTYFQPARPGSRVTIQDVITSQPGADLLGRESHAEKASLLPNLSPSNLLPLRVAMPAGEAGGNSFGKEATMQRSGSQKALLVISIIDIVCAAFVLIMGIMALVGVGAAGSIDTGDADINGVVRAGAGAAFGLASIIALVSGGWSLFCGILGVRAANDNQKIMIVWVFSLIALALQVITILMSIFNGDFGSNWLSYLLSLVWPALMFWIANNIKQEAGR